MHIDSDRDNDVLDQIYDGSFFIRKCTKCGAENVLNFPVGYENVYAQKSIFFFPIDGNINKNTIHVPNGARVTNDMLSFIEKVKIAEMDMDDKIIELVKIISCNQIVKLGQVPNEGLENIRCCLKSDKSMDLNLNYSGRHFLVEVPYQMYQDVKTQFGSMLSAYKEPSVVDLNWAIMFLNSLVIEESQLNPDDDWDEIVF
jgi:hypothetical protein